MAQWSISEARKRCAKALEAKQSSDPIYQKAMNIVFPNRENFTPQQEGATKDGDTWDSAATVSVIRSANRLTSEFTPQFQDWLQIKLGPAAEYMSDDAFTKAIGATRDEARAILEATTAIVQAVFHGPGFPTASHEMYMDWRFGQGGMSIQGNSDEAAEPVVFEAIPLTNFYAYEGINGRLDRWFMWHSLPADMIMEQWPDATITKEITDAAAAIPAKKIELVSVVYYDYDPKQRKEPYRYEVFAKIGEEHPRIVERTARTGPFVTPRYSKLAGENRGRGPVLFAMPDIRTANKIVELTLRAAAVAVSGVYTATDGVEGPIRIAPLSVIRVRTNGGPNGPALQRLDTAQRIEFGELLLEKLHENIKRVLGDNSLPPEASPIRSATEFVQRVRELLTDEAGGYGRLLSEFIIPAVRRVIDILEGRQLIDTKGLTVDQFFVQVSMTSPLARGESMAEVENIVRFIELLKMLGGDEVSAMYINLDRSIDEVANLMNVPVAILNSKDERMEAKKGMAKVAAAGAGGDPAVAGAELERAEASAQQGAQ